MLSVRRSSLGTQTSTEENIEGAARLPFQTKAERTLHNHVVAVGMGKEQGLSVQQGPLWGLPATSPACAGTFLIPAVPSSVMHLRDLALQEVLGQSLEKNLGQRDLARGHSGWIEEDDRGGVE